MQAIIFDLDNCLCPGNAAGEALYEPVFSALRRENRGLLSEEQLAAAFSDSWRHPFDFVALRHGFSDAMRAAGWAEFVAMEVGGALQAYADVTLFDELDGIHFLVTSGFRRLQGSKIKALGLMQRFAAIYIDAIDDPDRKGKQAIFAEILAEYGISRRDAIVVGDNPDSEIRAGNNLGIETVQILRPGVSFSSDATFHIDNLAELKTLLAARSVS